MQELLTPVTIGNEQYYPRKAVDAALQALNSVLDAKTEENARMVVRCFELRRAHDSLSRAHTELESRYDDLYKDWAAVVEISRNAIGELNSLRKLAGTSGGHHG